VPHSIETSRSQKERRGRKKTKELGERAGRIGQGEKKRRGKKEGGRKREKGRESQKWGGVKILSVPEEIIQTRQRHPTLNAM